MATAPQRAETLEERVRRSLSRPDARSLVSAGCQDVWEWDLTTGMLSKGRTRRKR
jgi:hypothetical protein